MADVPAPGTPARSDAGAAYVGVRYDPMPAGVSYESGSVILGADGKPSRFVLSHVKTPSGSMTWLDEMLPDEGTTRRRIVRASMDDPGGNPDRHLVVGTCGVDGRFSGDVVALVYNAAAEKKPGTVARAWRANPASARFDVISTKGVVCDEPGG